MLSCNYRRFGRTYYVPQGRWGGSFLRNVIFCLRTIWRALLFWDVTRRWLPTFRRHLPAPYSRVEQYKSNNRGRRLKLSKWNLFLSLDLLRKLKEHSRCFFCGMCERNSQFYKSVVRVSAHIHYRPLLYLKNTRAARKVSSHFEYLENRSRKASLRRTYCASVNSHCPVGLVSRQWDAADWTCVLCDRRIHNLLTCIDAAYLICSLGHCECDGHTVNKPSQRRLTANWLDPRESDCSRTGSKVSSDWLPSYIKVTRPVLEIFKMAGYFPDRSHVMSRPFGRPSTRTAV